MAAPTATVVRDGEEREVPARELVPGDVILLARRRPRPRRRPADRGRSTSRSRRPPSPANRCRSRSRPPRWTADLGGGRPHEHGLRRHGRHLRPGPGAWSSPPAWRPSSARSPSCSRRSRRAETPLQQNLDRVGRVLARAGLVVVVVVVGLGTAARPAVPGDAGLRHRPGRGRGPRGPAGRGHHLAGPGRAADGQAPRPDPPPARRGDPGQRLRHLLRQDRHADPGRDDRPPHLRGRRVASRSPAPATSREASSSATAGRSSRPRRSASCSQAAVLASDARLVAWRTALGNPGRSHRRRPARGRRQGRARQGRPRRTAPPRRRDPLHLRDQADDHPAPDARGRGRLFAKGAPEVLLASCARRRTAAGEEPLDDAGRQEILEAAQRMAGEALRVLGGRRPARRHPGERRARPDLPGAGGHDRSAAAGGEGGHPRHRARPASSRS